MYKLLLCTRYLRTRYLAFVCIVSVMLGVATLIVVNSVMSGFSNKLKDRLHGVLSEVMIETDRADGFDEPPDVFLARVKASPVGHYVDAVSPTVETVAMLQFYVRNAAGQKVPIVKHVRLVGIDPEQHAKVGRFSDYLKRQKGAAVPTFDPTPAARERRDRNLFVLGWEPGDLRPRLAQPGPTDIPAVSPPPEPGGLPIGNPRAPVPPSVIPGQDAPPRVPGVILGFSIAHNRYANTETGVMEDSPLLREGDDVFLATVGATGLKPVSGTFLVTDFFQSEMSEYDNSFVYVPVADLQAMKGMGDRVNSYQVKLTPEAAADTKLVHATIIPELQKLVPRGEGRVVSWQQHQGPLLAAIDVERGLLNVLLFLIVGVAGFSVLAIFTMIVGEKIRDIGVMKSLGASSLGVAQIFVGYGLLLGLVGCACGTVAGLLLTHYLNEVERALAVATGQQIFDRSIYYFDKIPTNIEAGTVLLVNVGAAAIAVLFSVIPAVRAARLHPVRALRFE